MCGIYCLLLQDLYSSSPTLINIQLYKLDTVFFTIIYSSLHISQVIINLGCLLYNVLFFIYCYLVLCYLYTCPSFSIYTPCLQLCLCIQEPLLFTFSVYKGFVVYATSSTDFYNNDFIQLSRYPYMFHHSFFKFLLF